PPASRETPSASAVKDRVYISSSYNGGCRLAIPPPRLQPFNPTITIQNAHTQGVYHPFAQAGPSVAGTGMSSSTITQCRRVLPVDALVHTNYKRWRRSAWELVQGKCSTKRCSAACR